MSELVTVNDAVRDVAIVTLNRPEKRNALSIALRDRLSDTLDQLASREDVKSVVITGAGDVFCAGFDLSEFEALGADPSLGETLWSSSDRFHRTVLRFPLPLVAAVNGPALGGGFDLAVMCDLRVAADTARFSHPEAPFSEVVYAPLHDLVGGGVARELCLTGREIDADGALAAHLVSSVVRPHLLLDEALRICTDITRAPRELLVRMKEKFISRAGVVTGGTLSL